MKQKAKIGILFAVFILICIVPKPSFASDRSVNFNKKKSVVIKEADCYAKSGNYTWLRYKPSANGYLSVKASTPQNALSFSKGYLALYDSTKSRVLSSKQIFYNTMHSGTAYWSPFIFGLEKGNVYYIRVKGENAVAFSRKFTKVSDKSGASYTSALSLKKNKMKTGLIPAGVSNADWYKITLTKQQNLRLYYNAKTHGKFKLTLYYGTQPVGVRYVYYTQKLQKIIFSMTYQNKKIGMRPGTYYVKMERENASSSGYYKLKWK